MSQNDLRRPSRIEFEALREWAILLPFLVVAVVVPVLLAMMLWRIVNAAF
jgi:hypothetical protein